MQICQTRRRETGQGLLEYALILMLVAVVVILILTQTGRDVEELFGSIQCSIQYQRQAYVERAGDEQTLICYVDVAQPDGTTQKVEIGPLNT